MIDFILILIRLHYSIEFMIKMKDFMILSSKKWN